MRLFRFTAATAGEALRQVKEALGDDALVLSTRQVAPGEVEITAATDFDANDDDVRRCEAAPEPVRLPDLSPTAGSAVAGGLAAAEDPAGVALLHREMRKLGVRLAAIDCRLRESAADPIELGAAGREVAAALESRGLARRIASPVAAGFERELAGGLGREAALAVSLTRHLPVAERASGARITVFVGPTGAGKTTMIAKLAAARVAAGTGRRPGLVLADTHRVGAAEHIGAYARLLGLPLRRLDDPRRLASAVGDLGACDEILVDTAGFASEGERLEAAVQLVAAAGEPIDVVAVLSAASSASALDRAWAALRRLAPTACAVTKLDECDEPGEACTWVSEAGVALRWLGTGPDVPGGLLAASGESLVRCLVAA